VIMVVVTVKCREIEMSYYVGLNVDVRSSSLCIVDDLGRVCLERTVASEIEEITLSVRSFSDRVAGVALETGNLAPWLATVPRGRDGGAARDRSLC
jgi:hypothetical protein